MTPVTIGVALLAIAVGLAFWGVQWYVFGGVRP